MSKLRFYNLVKLGLPDMAFGRVVRYSADYQAVHASYMKEKKRYADMKMKHHCAVMMNAMNHAEYEVNNSALRHLLEQKKKLRREIRAIIGTYHPERIATTKDERENALDGMLKNNTVKIEKPAREYDDMVEKFISSVETVDSVQLSELPEKWTKKQFFERDEVQELKESPGDSIKKGEVYCIAVPRWVSKTDHQVYAVGLAEEDMTPGVRFSPHRPVAVISKSMNTEILPSAEEARRTAAEAIDACSQMDVSEYLKNIAESINEASGKGRHKTMVRLSLSEWAHCAEANAIQRALEAKHYCCNAIQNHVSSAERLTSVVRNYTFYISWAPCDERTTD